MNTTHTPSLALAAMLAATPVFSAPSPTDTTNAKSALVPPPAPDAAPMPPKGEATPLMKQTPMLSPSDELKTIQLPDGYRLELVLSEPDIKEPMAIAFDGNGRMYVVEMRTYMQDIDGTGELDPKSRVSRHESTKGDGVFDKHTVFADNLVVPRMVLPLQDSVLIGETNTNDVNEFRDTKHDGVSDQKKPWFEGGPRGGNMEHQPSGLVWAMDNWIYTTYNAYRLRWNPKGATLKEPTAPNGGQWGLCQDDYGKPWFSNAGGEKGVWNFQTHVAYGAINVPSQWDDSWMTVWPAVGMFDVQGGKNRHRADGTLNHFTASCGQEIFRGDRLPADMRGNVFLPEPVGRMIRRGIVEVKDGVTTLKNPYPESEFIRSTDPLFRPVNMATGPDGCLYIVDAYRGIIQEGNWVRPDSFLRPQVQRWGLQNDTNRGRIWRLVHKDFKPGPQPHMLDETPAQLVAHLEHPNGFWRDTAQKLLVVRQDMSVVPALQTMARTSKNPLARMHAMWTLEGLGALDATLAREKLKDENPRVRENAIRATESLIKAGDKSFIADITAMAGDSDPNVVIQVIGTAKVQNFPDWEKLASLTIASSKSAGVQEIGKALVTSSKPMDTKSFSKDEIVVLKKGEAIYKELCFACHGFDGKGMPMQGKPGVTMAPPFAGSKTIAGHRDGPVLVLLQGLAGPVNGKTYEAQMVSMATNSDDWIASVASYVRNSFGNSGAFVTPAEVKRLRVATKDRTQPWTQKELMDALPQPLGDSKKWKLTASVNPAGCSAAIDGNATTRWDTHASQAPGQWFQIELPAETEIAGVRLDSTKSANDFPRGYKVELSADGVTWGKPVAEGKGSGAITDIPFAPAKAKFIRITQTGTVQGKFWSIHELAVLKPGGKF
jgi:mono/diheme cytochrome c family protein/glucose/arabinose dehydrogenase